MNKIPKDAELKEYIIKLKKENEELKADYGTKTQVERDILLQTLLDIKEYCENNKEFTPRLLDILDIVNRVIGEDNE